MTIGFDASRAFVEGRTGTENYSYQLLKHLSHIDIQNSYLIYIRESQKLKVKSQKWPSNFEFKVIDMPRLWTQVGLAFRTWFDPLDVLFVPSHTLPLLKKPGLKTVITVHDLGAEYLPAMHQLKQSLYLNFMTHHQLKTATHIIAVSEATKKDIVKRVGVSEKKISVVYEGVDKNVFKLIPRDAVNDIVKRFDLEREKYFLFVGTIQPRKNLERLIRAFSEFLENESRDFEVRSGKWDSEVGKLDSFKDQIDQKMNKSKNLTKTSHISHPTSNFKLVLVGQKGWKSDEIYDLPKQLGLEKHVLFTGRVSDPDLVGLYNGAIGLTYPSLFEGFGLPIIEAFACGCPVITSDTSSMPEITGNGAVLVDPYNIEAIKKAMLKLSSDDIFRSSLINKGSVRYSKFDWRITAKQTIDILTKI